MSDDGYAIYPPLLAICFLYLLWRKDTIKFCRNLYTIIFPRIHQPHHRQHEVAAAAVGYREYSYTSRRELERMRGSYGTINRQHKRIGFELGYTRKLNRLGEVIDTNALITNEIAQMAGDHSRTITSSSGLSAAQSYQQLERVREVLKQFVREWSIEGEGERSKTFLPILEVLMKVSFHNRQKTKVLVPGAGLGRLAWEIASLGFDTTSNEISPYMNLAFQYLLSRTTTSRIHQHVIHPFAHWFSHQRTNGSLFRSVTFPDVLPSLFPMSTLRHEESDFLDATPVTDGYNYIVTHYFIDTSHNIITTLQKLHSLLRCGGTWINLGPLLWMNGGQATMELSLEEILELSSVIGFEIQNGSRQIIPSEYTRDVSAMMRWIYEAEFWIAIKS